MIYANASGRFTSGATQTLSDGDLGFNWSAPRANLFLGDFNGDGKHDVLVQAKPKIAMIDYEIPIPVSTYPPNLNGVAYAQGGTTPFQLAYIRQWSRNDNGADWSPNSANIIVGDFDGNGRADVILQARNPATPSRLLSGNATGVAFGAASTLAANVTWAANSYRLIAGNFDGAGGAGVYFQSTTAGGANTYANVVTSASISTTTHDPSAATGVMPVSAVGRTPGAAAVSTSGTAQYSIPFALPPGRNGLTPQLGLVYDSAAGRGVAGLGWSIAGTSVIARCEKTVAQDGEGKAVRGALDDGYCLNGNRLRLVSGSYGVAGSTYRTELNGFSRITALGATTNGPASFKVETVDGRIHYYGDTTDSRIALLGTSIVRTWALSRIEDRSQNTIAFSWAKDTVNGSFRLAAVRYTGTPVETGPYLVDFQYTARADVNAGYTAGSKVQQVHRLMTVEITYQGTRVRRYSLQYDVSSVTARERLTSVQECAGATLDCLAPTTFTYQNGSIGLGALQTPLSNVPSGARAIDINGDGRDDLLYASAATNGTYMIAFANAAGGFNAPINTGVAVHAGSIHGDYNLDGKADVLSPISGTWWVKLGTATGLAAPVSTGTPATATGTGDNATLLDVNGDGYPDLVWADQVGFQGGDAVRYRAGLTTGGFSGTVQTLVGPLSPRYADPCGVLGPLPQTSGLQCGRQSRLRRGLRRAQPRVAVGAV